MADRNAPVGANLARAARQVGEFFTAEGDRPAPGGAYSMTAEEEREEAARFMRELQARRAARAAERSARPSAITNRPVGGNLAAAQPPAAATAAAARRDLATSDAVMRAPTAAAQATDPEAERVRRMNEADADSARTPPGVVRPTRGAGATRTRPTPSRRREMTADELNQISLELARGTRQGSLVPGAEQNIARRMGAGGYNYKKGGVVGKKPGIPAVAKKAAGGKVKTPSVSGRSVGRPATKVAATGTRQMAKAIKPTRPVAMPFKKGGKVSAKGKK